MNSASYSDALKCVRLRSPTPQLSLAVRYRSGYVVEWVSDRLGRYPFTWAIL